MAMGLIKTGLKAAVAVKVGHMVHDRIQQRQQTHGAAEGQPTEPSSGAAAPDDDVLAQLSKLAELKESGILTEAEFQAQKTRILSG
jgi:hypothetical protein